MRLIPQIEPCEARAMPSLVFVLNGNSFTAAGPNTLTANAAAVLRQAGHRVVQLANGPINSPGAFRALASRVEAQANGREVGLVGFSAGGALALRLAASPGLKVSAVLDYYGVPDVRAYLQRHAADHSYRPIAGLAPFQAKLVDLLSGPVSTSAHVTGAFGRQDPKVDAASSSADLLRDTPGAAVFTYAGGHGARIAASRPALDDFLAHLG